MNKLTYFASVYATPADSPAEFASRVKENGRRLYEKTRTIPSVIEVPPGTPHAHDVEGMRCEEVANVLPGHIQVGGVNHEQD